MSDARPENPIIAVLTAPEEDRPPGLDQLAHRATLRFASTRGEFIESIGDADVLLVTDFRTTIARDAWPHAKRLQWVHATSAGVDAILFPELRESDIPVTNAAGVFDRGIAETVLCYILAFAKGLPRSLEMKRRRIWEHRDTERIDGRRVLVVGAGSIGRSIARLVRTVGMAVDGVASRPRSDDPDFDVVFGSVDLYEALPRADYVVVATPLTNVTRGLFGAEAFRCMQPSARLINVGRGPVVQTDALVDALHAGRIAGAALDVLEEEPLPEEHPLWDMPQVIITAHMAGDFIGWREALSKQFIDNFNRWMRGDALVNVVDKRRGYGTTHAKH